jgi:hypothetical protein
MASKVAVSKVIDDLEKIINTWGENPNFSLPDGTTRQQLEELRSEIISDNEDIEVQRTKLTGMIDRRDDKASRGNDLAVRARSGIKFTYGADSAQYKQAGGTPLSERKPRARKSGTT